MTQRRPFEGLRVIDATHVLAGPYCSYQLALLGAEVIKVESPTEPDPVRGRGPVKRLNDAGLGFNYLVQNSNKKSIALDIKAPAGRDVFRRLASGADIVVENFRAGSFAALGLGYEDIRALNPKVIYCSITAFGQGGPWAQRTAYDPTIQGFSGIMARGPGGIAQPSLAGAPFIDYGTGLSAAFAIAAALYHRERTGEGQRIDCAMLDLALVMTGPALAVDAYNGEKTRQPHEAGISCYRTKDGFFQLGAYNFRQNRRLWTALGRPDFAALNTWPAIWENAPRMREALEDIFPTRTSAEWEEFVATIRVPGACVRTLAEAVRIEQIEARGFLHELPALEGVEGVRVPVAPFTYAEGGPAITAPPPRLGEHTDALLAGLGYGAQDIATLRRDGVV
jgi:crotonobetainyl-CoA:carnitine CoA-transferase CaiB-like acyl-CoA transferase